MSNLRLGYINRADSATITANPVAAALSAVSYLQNDSRGDVFVAGTTGAQEIKLTWGGTAYSDITQLCLWRHNCFYSGATPATVTVVFYSDAAWTTTISTIAATAMFSTTFSPYFIDWGWAFTNIYFAAPAAVKSVKITITVAVVVAAQISRLFLGPYTEAPIQIGEGAMVMPENNSVQGRSYSGSLRTLTKADWRVFTFEMMVKTEAHRAIWYEIARYVGNSKSFVACADPGGGTTLELHTTLYGKFERSPGTKLSQGRYDLSMKILEI